MKAVAKHWRRIAVTLIPVLLVLLHAMGVARIGVIQRLDDIIYDARLQATMPRTLDDRIIIIDIDEKSLAELGRWPWGRNKLAELVDTLFIEQHVAVLGFDVVFAEADESSGLVRLNQLASQELKHYPAFAERLKQLQPDLDFDARFARAIANRPVVMGYYLTSDKEGRSSGVLPAPVLSQAVLQGRQIRATSWTGYGANIEQLARSAPAAGFFNSITDGDGVVRSLPLLAEYKGQYYESIALAMFRVIAGMPTVAPGFSNERFLAKSYQGMDRVLLKQGDKALAIPVDERVATLVPYRGYGGVSGGSFRYISAADIVNKRLPSGALKGKVVLLGTTAPGLLDLRVTPVGEIYPGVETHANIISSLLDGNVLVKPDYAMGCEVVMVLLSGLLLAIGLPLLSAPRAVLLSVAVFGLLTVMNLWLYLGHGLVLPLASVLVMAVTAFGLNMSYGYFVESRSKR
ncbi:MAG: CHASE2 domain-containing protein, partial [Burkholderiaceae bacterium]|nr:CHASE2 domain-containing protein [Burkholderiaceae bacterium]